MFKIVCSYCSISNLKQQLLNESMHCDLCGKAPQAYKANIEGTVMLVCQSCAKFGKVLGRVVQQEILAKQKNVVQQAEPSETIVANFAKLIRNKREHLKETHEVFAGKLGIKTSILHKIEADQFTPDLEAAKRFEKILGLKLITLEDTKTDVAVFKAAEGMTLGDFIKVRK